MTRRSTLACAALSVLLAPHAAARAEALPTAVFPFALDDTSLEGELQGQRADEQARLRSLDAQLRDLLAASGCCAPLDPARLAVPPSDLRSCAACAVEAARQAGAALAVTPWVQKVSNLILNINLEMHDAASGRLLTRGSVDIRGNTDESWSRGLTYLVRHRLPASGWVATDPAASR